VSRTGVPRSQESISKLWEKAFPGLNPLGAGILETTFFRKPDEGSAFLPSACANAPFLGFAYLVLFHFSGGEPPNKGRGIK